MDAPEGGAQLAECIVGKAPVQPTLYQAAEERAVLEETKVEA